MAFQYISPTEFSMVGPIVFAAILGVLIGIDRELRGKSAGIGTNVLIGVGAVVFTQLSIIIDPNMPTRIAANIVTGIGFIGAGLILKKDSGGIHGLTTAAGIWTTAAIGMAIGFGFFFLAVIVAIISVIAPRIPNFGPHLTSEEGSRQLVQKKGRG